MVIDARFPRVWAAGLRGFRDEVVGIVGWVQKR